MHDEVRTEEIIKDVFRGGKSCFIPRYESSSNHMDMLQLRSMEDMKTLPLTSWNIRQPTFDDQSREEALSAGESEGSSALPVFSSSLITFSSDLLKGNW